MKRTKQQERISAGVKLYWKRRKEKEKMVESRKELDSGLVHADCEIVLHRGGRSAIYEDDRGTRFLCGWLELDRVGVLVFRDADGETETVL